MQLSVTNPPIDPNLAALLLGNISPATVAPDAAAGAPLAGFAAWLEQSGSPTGAAIVPETPTEGGEMPADPSGAGASPPTPWAFASSVQRSQAHPLPSQVLYPLSNHPTGASNGGATDQLAAPGVTASVMATPSHTLSPASAKANSGKAQAPAATVAARHAEKAIGQGSESASLSLTAERAALASVESTPQAAIQPASIDEPHPAAGASSSEMAPMSVAASEQLAATTTLQPSPGSLALSAELTAAAAEARPAPLALGASSGEKFDTSSEVARSANGSFGSRSPFPSELRSRGPVEWPLTAHPETKPAEGELSSLPGRGEAMSFEGETVTSPFQLPAKTTLMGERVFNPTARDQASAGSLPASASSALAPVPAALASLPALALAAARPEPTVAGQLLAPDASTAAHATQARISVEHTATASREPGVQSPDKKPGANFAVSNPTLSPRPSSAESGAAKHFVSAASARVTEGRPALGTDVANPLDAMPSAPTLPPEAATAHDSVAAVASSASHAMRAEASFETHFAPEATSTAHRAVEAVLSAVHRFTARDHHAVNLQFSVGGADLSVRVEMRADEVRATFTTDSAELRAALSHEWHAAQSTSTSDRPVRLANPVFASSDGSNFGTADQNASRHRKSQSGDSNQPFSLAGLRTRAARAAAFEASVPVVAPVISRAPLSTTLHLHTLA